MKELNGQQLCGGFKEKVALKHARGNRRFLKPKPMEMRPEDMCHAVLKCVRMKACVRGAIDTSRAFLKTWVKWDIFRY